MSSQANAINRNLYTTAVAEPFVLAVDYFPLIHWHFLLFANGTV